MHLKSSTFGYLFLLLAAFPLNAAAQEKTAEPSETKSISIAKNDAQTLTEKPSFKLSTKENEKEEAVETAAETEKTQSNNECKLCRWIDLQTATFATRFRVVKSNQRVSAAMTRTQPFLKAGEFVKTNQNQQQQIYEFDFKFDKAGRFKIHTRLSSGEWFTRSFAETGWGKDFNGEKTWAVYPRQFYLSAEPVKGVEFQIGGLDINRGENTENTTYDNDGFITGERLKIKRPDKLWFDEISATNAYIGDFYTPNFFQRAKRIGQGSNYHQFLVAKKFGKRVAVSMDYTSHATISHLREAVFVKTPELKFIDNIRVEFYHRLEDYRGVKRGWGYNVQVEKKIGDKFELTAGVANTDYRYNVLTTEKFPARQARYAQPAGTLTADRMIRGLSPFVGWKYNFNKYYGVFGFWTTDLNKPTPLPFVYNSDHFSVGFQVNIKNILKKTGWF